MATATHRWDSRLDRVVIWLLWITLTIGVFSTFVVDGPVASSYAAVGVAGIYVLALTVLPTYLTRRHLVREAVVLAGSVLTMTAVAMTRHVASPFMLLALMPVLFSAVRGGFRDGLGSAALSVGILATVVFAQVDPPWIDLLRWSVLFFLVAVTFGYAHRLLTEEGARSDALVAASAENSVRLERLESAHRLLTRLASRAETAELNPIEVGNDALSSVRSIVPFRAASISLLNETGLVSVARIGVSAEAKFQSTFPMEAGGRRVGSLIVGTDRELNASQRDSISAVLAPANLAFGNILLLQNIARVAIREERARLARELHDDIGPSLASLGLALDLAAIQYPTEPALGVHLNDLRDSVAELVEDVRTTVSDLRVAGDQPSLRDAVRGAIRDRPGEQPAILYEVDERSPARPSIAEQVIAIIVEAVRNAINHSGASTVRIQGFIDFGSGILEVRDNGRGFDVDAVEQKRYGLIGMRERSASVGAELQISSHPGETSVTLKWGAT